MISQQSTADAYSQLIQVLVQIKTSLIRAKQLIRPWNSNAEQDQEITNILTMIDQTIHRYDTEISQHSQQDQ